MGSYVFGMALFTSIIYILFSLILTIQFKSIDSDDDRSFMTSKILNRKEISPIKCKHLPRLCLNCDCKQLCDNENAALFQIDRDPYFNLPRGTYCYEASTDVCKPDYGTWVYKHSTNAWICIPKDPAQYTGDGTYVFGNYPLTSQKPPRTDSGGKFQCGKDEHENDLILFEHSNGIVFCGKDYCKNNYKMANEIGYYDSENNKCNCHFNGKQLLDGDEKGHCLTRDIEIKTIGSLDIRVPIYCYGDETFVIDTKSRLCYDKNEDFLQQSGIISIKNGRDIGLV